MLKRLSFVILLMSLCAAAVAQVPQAMTYQAVVRDADGRLFAGATIGVRLSLRQGTATGPTVYQEVHHTTTNANGLYTLRFGTGDPTRGTFATIAWDEGPYYAISEVDSHKSKFAIIR